VDLGIAGSNPVTHPCSSRLESLRSCISRGFRHHRGSDSESADEPIRDTKPQFERTKEALAVLKARGVKLGASRSECQNLTDADRKRGSETAAKARTAQAVDDMQDVAELAVRMRSVEGCTLQKIADHLNSEGIPSRHGAAWNPMMVKRVIDRASTNPS
jgi:Recombinase